MSGFSTPFQIFLRIFSGYRTVFNSPVRFPPAFSSIFLCFPLFSRFFCTFPYFAVFSNVFLPYLHFPKTFPHFHPVVFLHHSLCFPMHPDLSPDRMPGDLYPTEYSSYTARPETKTTHNPSPGQDYIPMHNLTIYINRE